MSTIQEMTALIPSAYSVAEIDAYGKEGVTLTITAFKPVKVGKEDEEKPALFFKENSKFLVINKTRGQQLGDLFGPANDPSGEKVKLAVGKPMVNGRPIEQIVITEA